MQGFEGVGIHFSADLPFGGKVPLFLGGVRIKGFETVKKGSGFFFVWEEDIGKGVEERVGLGGEILSFLFLHGWSTGFFR